MTAASADALGRLHRVEFVALAPADQAWADGVQAGLSVPAAFGDLAVLTRSDDSSQVVARRG